LQTLNDERTALRCADRWRRWHASAIRELQCHDGELTCVRVLVPYERREGPGHVQ